MTTGTADDGGKGLQVTRVNGRKQPKRQPTKIHLLKQQVVEVEKLMNKRCEAIALTLQSHQQGINEIHRRLAALVTTNSSYMNNMQDFMKTVSQQVKKLHLRVESLELQESLLLENEGRGDDKTCGFDFDVKDWGLHVNTSEKHSLASPIELAPPRKKQKYTNEEHEKEDNVAFVFTK